MAGSHWIKAWNKDPRIEAIRGDLKAHGRARAGSVHGSAQALLILALAAKAKGPVLCATQDPESAADLALDLEALLGDAKKGAKGRPVFRFPAWTDLPGLGATPSPRVFADRLEVLRALAEGEGKAGAIIAAPIAALLQPVPPPRAVDRAALRVRVGMELSQDALIEKLDEAGLTRRPLAELAGEWSQRGSIVDVFAYGAERPVRFDYFGDTIEEIRTYDPENQRSEEALTEVSVPLGSVGSLFGTTRVLRDSLLAHLPKSALVAVLEPDRVHGMAKEIHHRYEDKDAYLDATDLLDAIAARSHIEVGALPFESGPQTHALSVGSVERAGGADTRTILKSLEDLIGEGLSVTLCCPTSGDLRRLTELTEGRDGLGTLILEERPLKAGFHDRVLDRALVTSHEIFQRSLLRRRRSLRKHRVKSQPIQSFVELKPGDFVVHVVHGVAKYLGIEALPDHPVGDHLVLLFQDGVKVYVPATKVELVQRYLGAKGTAPRLSKVGGKSWAKKKARAKKAVLDLAAELIDIQAARDAQTGTVFPKELLGQLAGFEASFAYEDTPDQETATSAIKIDMTRPRPMDRLICGDVGYGKTEVAMRAAFLATRAGKQVAVLVPTTLLAEQHQKTFSERFGGFGVTVRCLSRFRKGKETRAILEAMKEGNVDIVIGTHRLLSQDVIFKDLGLLVIDEEQRFGVAHKERLKHIRRTVDVLTLTATPIPRTLHMSLLGIKDISSLETPPEGRRAIETAIARAHPGLIREAILREISRHGQVFFVHNRVQSIGRRAEELRRLVPEARFVVGHGQMHEDELAHRMLSFIGGEADVLVCTTIIESGIDIPRANTILIDRADRFGLSDLHQLRGRVGRYHNKAYAYMLLAPSGRASTTGLKRVKAIEEYQELGAGFKIAMRDLEIRGAGSLLGSSQSGFISLVGYDLYCRLLQQAVHEIRERGSIDKVRWQRKLGVAEAEGFDELTLDATMVDAQDHPELAFEKARFGERARARALGLEASVEVQLPLEARLSRRYIEDDRQRIEIYRKLANASSEKDIAALQAELTDRFGKPPEPAARLLRIAQLRILIEPLGVFRVTAEGKAAIVELDQKTHRFKAALSRAGVTGKWADPRTCYLIVSNKADPPANQVLERLLAIFAPSLRERARKSPRGRKKSGPRHPARRS